MSIPYFDSRITASIDVVISPTTMTSVGSLSTAGNPGLVLSVANISFEISVDSASFAGQAFTFAASAIGNGVNTDMFYISSATAASGDFTVIFAGAVDAGAAIMTVLRNPSTTGFYVQSNTGSGDVTDITASLTGTNAKDHMVIDAVGAAKGTSSLFITSNEGANSNSFDAGSGVTKLTTGSHSATSGTGTRTLSWQESTNKSWASIIGEFKGGPPQGSPEQILMGNV